jgi:hypothetical protein
LFGDTLNAGIGQGDVLASPLQLAVLTARVATGREVSRAARYLAGVVQRRIEIPYPFLVEIVAKAELTPEMDESSALRRLIPFHAEILRGVYRHIREQCAQRGIVAALNISNMKNKDRFAHNLRSDFHMTQRTPAPVRFSDGLTGKMNPTKPCPG